jgi:hypothetical protein
MKVLATDFDCPHHDVWATLRPLPDGIDQLCGGTGFDVDAPASPGDVASNDG